ncbi:hypothetical protein GGR50DRAFT_655999 [Xylaria sp. CBS 124048]|nr:hypothetical protein GGR50DRAFT_655999 [Xylaria sp. CBS 124048]
MGYALICMSDYLYRHLNIPANTFLSPTSPHSHPHSHTTSGAVYLISHLSISTYHQVPFFEKTSKKSNHLQRARVMRTTTILSALASLTLASLASASEQKAAIYIQAVAPSPEPPVLLAELQYDALAPAEAQVLTYEAPELSDDVETKLLRVGVYDPEAKSWTSSTSVASTENFDKGYSPALMLSVDRTGVPISAAVRGVRIDAGKTRDFGPQAVVLVTEAGVQPELNKPVVLSPEGKQVVPEEKSMFQKYWWVIAIVALMTVLGGSDEKKE